MMFESEQRASYHAMDVYHFDGIHVQMDAILIIKLMTAQSLQSNSSGKLSFDHSVLHVYLRNALKSLDKCNDNEYSA